ncbi:MAG TPA: hypothetical protein ENG50_00775 [Candidatus Altiarchaeales archaeon]|nr:hypothetical protein [Candidatus Altiarchaeales archaeon]
MNLTKILENSPLVLLLALILAFFFPEFAKGKNILIIVALFIAMSFSLTQLEISIAKIRKVFSKALKLFLVNYGFLSSLILILTFLLISNDSHRKGLIILASMPPAVAVIPFTYLLKGEINVALVSEALCYILAIFMAPLIMFLFLKAEIDSWLMINSLICFIVIPFAFSRFLMKFDPVSKYRKIVVNLSLAVVTYMIIALNVEEILADGILAVIFIMFFRTFISGIFSYKLAKRFVLEEEARTISLFSAYKNSGLAATIALILFDVRAALPAALSSIFEILYVIWFMKILKKSDFYSSSNAR